MPHISIYPRRRIEVPSLRDGDVDVAQSAHNQKPVGALFRAPAEDKAPSLCRPPSPRPRQHLSPVGGVPQKQHLRRCYYIKGIFPHPT